MSEVVRANVSDGRVALPVRGGIYARLNHIAAVPAGSTDQGYSLARLRAIDSMITRIARLRETAPAAQTPNSLEARQELIDQVARRIDEALQEQRSTLDPLEGLVIDLTA
jgi:hypothetical protein